jgi:hypothetical protein
MLTAVRSFGRVEGSGTRSAPTGNRRPEVEGEYRRLRARPTLIAATLAALAIGSGLVIRRRRR